MVGIELLNVIQMKLTNSVESSRQLLGYSRISQRFVEPGGSLTCSQEPCLDENA
jgi:hypothetical protein